MSRHRVVERVVLAVIVVNSVLLVAGMVWPAHRELFDRADDVCLGLFVVELLWRWHGARWRPGVVLVAETVIVAVAVLPVLGVDATLARLGRLCRVGHLARHHVTHLRVLRVVFRRAGVAS